MQILIVRGFRLFPRHNDGVYEVREIWKVREIQGFQKLGKVRKYVRKWSGNFFETNSKININDFGLPIGQGVLVRKFRESQGI